MTVTYPDVSTQTITVDVDPAVLLSTALAYHTAQYRLQSSSERAARDLFVRLRPISDADMAEWMDAWNTLLAAQQAQQGTLTTAYIRVTLGQFGVRLPRDVVVPASDAVFADLRRWVDSRAYRSASGNLRRQVDEALTRVASGGPSARDAQLADRVLNLAAPVVKVREATSLGATLEAAVNDVADHVEGVTYNTSRAAERMALDAVTKWPTFKNGQAMLYRRVPQAGACGWCILVATRLYPLSASKRGPAWHRGCRCSWQLAAESQVKAYDAAHKASEGDYFAAARAAGLWTGDAPRSYKTFISDTRYDPAAAATG